MTAPSINRIWRKREPYTAPLVAAQVYDPDGNLIMFDTNNHGETEVFALSESAMKAVPCSRLERAMMVLSSTPHQALLVLHTALQGNYC